MLVGCDFKQLEWRVCLEFARDEIGIDEVVNNQDTHELNRTAFELPTRRVAKFYLFRTIFRGTGWGFAHDPDFMHVSSDPKYWDNVNEQFYAKYSGIDRWHKRIAEQVSRGERVQTMFGRGWTFELGKDARGNPKLPWSVFTNYPVQGTGADIVTLFRVSLYRRIRNSSLSNVVRFVSTVHDSVIVDCQNEYVEAILQLFQEVARDLVPNIKKLFNYDWIVPLDVEGKVGPNLLDMKEV